MPYIVKKSSGGNSNATSHVLQIPAHDTNDLIILFTSHSGGTMSSTPTNWTQEAHDTYDSDIYCLSHIGLATPATTVTIACSTSTYLTYHFRVIKGAPTTGYVDVFAIRGNGGGNNPVNLPSVTTTTANCLVLASPSNVGGTQLAIPDVTDFSCSYGSGGTYHLGSVCSARYQLTAGATGEFLYQTEAVRNPGGITIAIKDSGSATIAAYKDPSNPPATLLNSFNTGNFGGIDGTNRRVNVTADASGDNTIPDIHGDATYSTDDGVNIDRGTTIDSLENDFPTTRLYTQGTSVYDDLPAVEAFAVSPSMDLTDKIISFGINISGQSPLTFAEGGAYFIASDGVDSMCWSAGGNGVLPDASKAFFPFLIQMPDSSDVSTGHEIQEYGTFNRSAVTRFGMGFRPVGGYTSIWFSPLYVLNTMSILGGYTGGSIGFVDVYNLAQENLLYTVQAQNTQSTGQFYCTQSIKIGNGGTNTTVWDSTGEAIEFPSALNLTDLRVQAQINAASLGVEFDFGTGNSATLDSNTYNMGDYHVFELTSGDLSTSGLLVLNGTVVLNPLDSALSGAAFSACKEITHNNCDLSGGCTISNSADTVAYTVTQASHLTNLNDCTLLNNTTAIQITGNQSGTWTGIEDITFTGNTTKIEYTGATDFTISVNAGTNLVTADITNSGAGTLTITAPAKGIVFNSLVADSQVKVFATGTTTERFTTASSGTSETYTATIEEDVDYTIMQAGYTPIRVVGHTVGANQATLAIQQQVDRAYVASSGLTYTTDTSATTGTKIFALSKASTLQNYYSHMIEEWIAQATLKNVEFPITPNGGNSFTLFNGWEFTNSTAIAFLSRDGLRYLDTGDTLTATWSAILTIGDSDTFTAEYQQVDGAAPTDAANTGNVDELIQVYGDATHGNFDYRAYMVLKYQENGYLQDVVDVVGTYSTLADEFYVVALAPTAITGFATGDPSITGVTITNHGATPVTWNSKDWSVTITDTGSNTGENIMRWINYNLSLDATFEGDDPFNYPDMVYESGTGYKTLYGDFIGTAGATLKGIRVIDGAGEPHSDFITMQADDASIYTVPVTATGAVSGMPVAAGASTRLQVTNETGRAGTAWATGQSVSAGDYYLRSTGAGAENNATGLFFVAGNSGTTHATTEPTWDTTAGNTTTDNDITWTCRNVQYYSNDPASASWSSNYTDGEEFASGDTVRIRFAELDAGTTFKTFTQNAVVTSSGFSVACDETADSVYATNSVDGSLVTKFTADFTNDEIDLSANENFHSNEAYAFYCYQLTVADGIEMFWDGVDSPDSGNYKVVTANLNLYFDNTTTASKRQTDAARIYRDDDTYPVKDPTTSGFGIDVNWKSQVYVVEVATGDAVNQATVQAALTAQGYTTTRAPELDTISTIDGKADDIKTKTEQLTFTKANELDSNAKSMNDVTINGTGIESDKWRG